MADLVMVKWYATVFRKDAFAADVAQVAPLALRYGATQYAVHVDNDDRYRVTQFTWVASKTDWYRYWDGPEMIEFRARNMGRYQVPIAYSLGGRDRRRRARPGGPDGRAQRCPRAALRRRPAATPQAA